MSIEYKGIVWLGIFVEDFDASIDFYQNTLELKLLTKQSDYAHFDAGNGALFELFSGGKKHNETKGSDKQSSLAALLVEDIEKTKAILKAKGVKFTANEGTYENTRWATMVDPEGNLLEIKEIN